jgi:hypothetical protein
MSTPPENKLVVFSIGGKGGSGKSWVMGLLLDWYQAQGLRPQMFELDNETSTTTRFHGEAEFIDVSRKEKLDGMLEKLARSPLSLIDMRAGSTDRIEPWWRGIDTAQLRREYGLRWTAIGVVDSSVDSFANIGNWAREVLKGDRAIGYVIAINEGRGGGAMYRKSPERKEYQKTLKPSEIEIPELGGWVRDELENASLRVGTALAYTDPKNPLTTFLNRMRLYRYQRAVFAQFDQIKEQLLP